MAQFRILCWDTYTHISYYDCDYRLGDSLPMTEL